MSTTEWFRGVPWEQQALTAAVAADVAEPVTEIARGFIAACQHDPTRAPGAAAPYRVSRGVYTAVVSAELVVVGHGRPEKAHETASDADSGRSARSKGGRGPKDYNELIRWLADEGIAVVGGSDSHRAVLNPRGVRVATLNSSPSDRRSFLNDVAACRRALGLTLRRHG